MPVSGCQNKYQNIFNATTSYDYNRFSSNSLIRDNLSYLHRLKLLHRLKIHNGCVNTVCWDERGEYILSGSDDQKLVITDPFTSRVCCSLKTNHHSNIFSAEFLPNTNRRQIISCSGDGIICLTDLDSPFVKGLNNTFTCHSTTCYQVRTIPEESNCFLSCSEDGTVRWYDLRVKKNCLKRNCKEDILIEYSRSIGCLDINPNFPWEMAIGSADGIISIYDRRMLGTKCLGNYIGQPSECLLKRFSALDKTSNHRHRITAVKYSGDGRDLLASYSGEQVYLFNLQDSDQTGKELITTPQFTAESESDQTDLSEINQQDSSNPKHPSKFLRLRGDWSDTGPSSRPSEEEENDLQNMTVMQRLSNMFTRWLETSVRLDSSEVELSESSEEESSNEEFSSDSSSSDEATSSQQNENVQEKSNKKIDSDSESNSVQQNESPTQSETQNEHNSDKVEDDFNSNSLSISTMSSQQKENNQKMYTDNLDTESKSISQNKPDSGPTEISKHSEKSQTELPNIDHKTDSSQRSPKPSTSKVQILPTPSTSKALDSFSEKKLTEPKNIEKCEASNDDILDQPNKIEFSINPPKSHANTAIKTHPTKNESPSTSHGPFRSSRPASDSHPYYGLGRSRVSARSDSPPASLLSEYAQSYRNEINPSEPNENQSENIRDTAASRIQTFFRQRKAQKQTAEEANSSSFFGARVQAKYSGHRNTRTMIKEACFWGDQYIVCGSDCGHLFFWDRYTAEVVMVLEGDRHVVNCIQPHPHLPVLASSGIDYDVKIWMPYGESNFDVNSAAEVINRNKVMLKETKDTITVPAAFMLRMIASMNRVSRSGNQSVSSSSTDSESETED